MFIVVEGIEGSGKSTLSLGIAARLTSKGYEVIVTREPGGSLVGDAVRAIFLRHFIEMSPLTETFLVNAARAQHVSSTISPALSRGQVVISDRFTDSTLAYQGYGRGLDLELIRKLCTIATGGVEPDLTFLMDVPVGVARGRFENRSDELTLFAMKQDSPGSPRARLKDQVVTVDRIESEGDDFHDRVRQGFLELAKSPKHFVLDGTRGREHILDDALRMLLPLLGEPVS